MLQRKEKNAGKKEKWVRKERKRKRRLYFLQLALCPFFQSLTWHKREQ